MSCVRIGGALFAICALLAPAGAMGAGFVVTPAFEDLALKAQGDSDPVVVKITNQNKTDQNFRLSVVDFGSLDEEGGVAFLGQPASELEHKYGLASWIRLETNSLFVPGGATKTAQVTVNNRPSLAPGGHYGAILATAVDEFGRPVASSVGVKQVLSSLLLVVKDGGALRELGLVEQTHNGGWLRLPGWVEYRFQNTGNVHLVPYGVVEVRDPAGRLVKRAALDEESAVILPESFRRYKTPLVHAGRAWLPGRYQIITRYRYDGSDVTTRAVKSFWYAGDLVIVLVIALAAAAAGVFSWWFWRRQRRRGRRRK